MSTSLAAVSVGVSICQCDALSSGTNSITQHPASLSLSASPPSSHPGPMHQAHTPQQPSGMGAQHMGPRSAAHSTEEPSQMNELSKHGRTGSSCQPSRSRSPAALQSRHTPTHITLTRAHSKRSRTLQMCRSDHCNGSTSWRSFSTDANVPLSEARTLPKSRLPSLLSVSFKVFQFSVLLYSRSQFVEANLARRTSYFHFANFQEGFIYLDVTCKNVKCQLLISPLLLFIILLYEQSRVSLPRCLLEHQA